MAKKSTISKKSYWKKNHLWKYTNKIGYVLSREWTEIPAVLTLEWKNSVANGARSRTKKNICVILNFPFSAIYVQNWYTFDHLKIIFAQNFLICSRVNVIGCQIVLKRQYLTFGRSLQNGIDLWLIFPNHYLFGYFSMFKFRKYLCWNPTLGEVWIEYLTRRCKKEKQFYIIFITLGFL